MNSIKLNRPEKQFLKGALAVLITVASVSLTCSTAQAQLLAGSRTVDARADQTVRVLAGSPFQNTEDFELQLSAVGTFTFGWDDEASGVSNISSFSAEFRGSDATLGGYSLFGGQVAPANVAAFGSMEMIDELGGDLVAADWTINSAFSIVLDAGPVIYTQEAAVFSGRFEDSMAGSVFDSPGEIDGYFWQGGDIANDSVEAVSFNRTVTAIDAVPEPSSVVILACIGGMSCLLRRRS